MEQAVPLVIPAAFDPSSLQAQINNKANASTVGGLATAINSKAAQSAVDALATGKADVAALAGKANVADIPLPADVMPKSEATSPAKGAETKKYALEDHQHPRITSATGNPATHIIGSNGLATVAFTQAFDLFPNPVFTEVPPPTGTMPGQPAYFRVESWIRETMSPAPAGKYVGCVVRAWRGRNLPVIGLLTGLLSLVGVNSVITALTGFDPFGAPATGTTFTCTAIKRSDG
ncbi:hypothetical protein [Sphingobium sp. Z007]|uniref:hypothetical protein n=1 Tax=Sphingobium sp. Z007 TaxID=627495 RepID=UPI000B4A4FBB|nr:hypothetical protein [Sphingobium sp. Z007]